MKNHSVDSWYPGDFELHTKQIALQQNDNDYDILRATAILKVPSTLARMIGISSSPTSFQQPKRKTERQQHLPRGPQLATRRYNCPAPAAAQIASNASHVDMAHVRQRAT